MKHLKREDLQSWTEYTREVARAHFIPTAVTQGHTNLILHNLHERRTIHYCFSSCCFPPNQCGRFARLQMSQSASACPRIYSIDNILNLYRTKSLWKCERDMPKPDTSYWKDICNISIQVNIFYFKKFFDLSKKIYYFSFICVTWKHVMFLIKDALVECFIRFLVTFPLYMFASSNVEI